MNFNPGQDNCFQTINVEVICRIEMGGTRIGIVNQIRSYCSSNKSKMEGVDLRNVLRDRMRKELSLTQVVSLCKIER